MSTAQVIQALMGGALVTALTNAYFQARARKGAERKTSSETEALDRQSITTAADALAMANEMRIEAQTALAAAHKRIGFLEAFIRRHGIAVPS